MHLLLATRNAHKAAEFAQILGSEFTVSDLRSLRNAVEVEESGNTFEANAVLKAVAASRLTETLVVADDSGLEVEALGGAPGIRSARYAGENASDTQNVAKLLRELDRVGDDSEAKARFYCALAVAGSGQAICTLAGEVHGRIIRQTRGNNGFGYDPVFVPEGFEDTFAALPVETKNAISHRARAIAALRDYLQQLAAKA